MSPEPDAGGARAADAASSGPAPVPPADAARQAAGGPDPLPADPIAADPVTAAIAAAVARRAAALDGAARDLLLRRAHERLAARAHPEPPPTAVGPDVPGAPAPGASAPLHALSALVDRLGRATPAAAAPLARGAAPPPLKAVVAMAPALSRLRAEQRVHQAQAQVPANAGPLNSSRVVHRALQTLREIAPGYLEALTAQVDTLIALEALAGGDARPAILPLRADAAPAARPDAAAPPRRAPRAKPAGRRGPRRPTAPAGGGTSA